MPLCVYCWFWTYIHPKCFFVQNYRGYADVTVRGWSFYLQFERSCRLDIPGSDPVFDLLAVLEQPLGFTGSLASSILSLDKVNPLPSSRREIIIE